MLADDMQQCHFNRLFFFFLKQREFYRIMLKTHDQGCKTYLSKGTKCLIQCQELVAWMVLLKGKTLHTFTWVQDGVYLPLLSYPELSPGSPQSIQCAAKWLRKGFTLHPAPATCALQHYQLEEPISFPYRNFCTFSSPNHLSKKHSIPGRRSRPATFQDTVFLFFQSKGLGNIHELRCNKYFLLQSSPWQRGYRPTREEMEIVNHFPKILVLGKFIQTLKSSQVQNIKYYTEKI